MKDKPLTEKTGFHNFPLESKYKIAKEPPRDELTWLIIKYWAERNLTTPNVWEALAFAQTELGETYEVLLADERWVRNNPDHKETIFRSLDFAEELGDTIMMLIVAGLSLNIDPIAALRKKIQRKLVE